MIYFLIFATSCFQTSTIQLYMSQVYCPHKFSFGNSRVCLTREHCLLTTHIMTDIRIAIFWDLGKRSFNSCLSNLINSCTENCRSFSAIPPQKIITNIRNAAHVYGKITSFRAYIEVTLLQPPLRSLFQSSGVSIIDCTHNGRKEVADQMMLGWCLSRLQCQFHTNISIQWISWLTPWTITHHLWYSLSQVIEISHIWSPSSP